MVNLTPQIVELINNGMGAIVAIVFIIAVAWVMHGVKA